MTTTKQIGNILKNEDALKTIANFLISVINWPIPNRIVFFFLPYALERAMELLIRSLPERIVKEAFNYVSDEIKDEGALSIEEAQEYASFLQSEVDIPWVPAWIEKKVFMAFVLLISFAASSGLDAVTAADNDNFHEEIRGQVGEV